MKKFLLSLAAVAMLAAPASAQTVKKAASPFSLKKTEKVALPLDRKLNINGKSMQGMTLRSANLFSRMDDAQRSHKEISYQVTGLEMQECGLCPLFSPGTLAQNGLSGYGLAQLFYGDMLSRYAGNTITSLNFAMWPGKYSNGFAFIIDGMTGKALWSADISNYQFIDASTGEIHMNSIPCDYVLTGEEKTLIIGWAADYAPNAELDPYASKFEGMMPYYVDNTGAAQGGLILGKDAQGQMGVIADASKLKDENDNVFAAASVIYLTTEGEAGLKDNDSYPASISTVRGKLNSSEQPQTQLVIANLGLDSLKSFDYTVQVGENTYSKSVTLKQPVQFYGATAIDIPTVLAEKAGKNIGKLTVTNVNGVADEYAENDDNLVKGFVYTFGANAFRRMPVMEEFTSNTCGWCPYGIWGLRDAVKECSDNAVAIAIHTTFNSQLGADPLASESYEPVVKNYAESFPSVLLNREGMQHPADIAPYARALSGQLCEANLNLSGAVSEGMTSSSIEGQLKLNFAFDVNEGEYGVAYVVKEDKVEGVRQLNYFTNTYYQYNKQYSDEAIMEGLGWTQEMLDYAKNSVVSNGNYWSEAPMDHVGVCIVDGEGNANPRGNRNHVPAVKAGEEVVLDFSFDVPSRKKPAVNAENLSLVALLIDQQSGAIVTAAEVKLTEEGQESGPSAIETVENAEAASIAVAEGAFTVTANNAVAEVYTVDGKLVSSCTVNGTASLPTFGTGAYVIRVKADGKVITKKATF